MVDFELAKLYVERVRLAHLTVILASSIILVTLSTDIFKHSKLLKEVEVVEILSEKFGISSEFLVDSVIRSISGQVSKVKVDEAHKFYKVVRNQKNIEFLNENTEITNDVTATVWLGLVGYFYEPIKDDTGFEDFFSNRGELVMSAQTFLHIWDDMLKLKDFRLITGLEQEKVYKYNRANGVYFPEAVCRTPVAYQVPNNTLIEPVFFGYLKSDLLYRIHFDVYIEDYCGARYEGIFNNIVIEFNHKFYNPLIVQDFQLTDELSKALKLFKQYNYNLFITRDEKTIVNSFDESALLETQIVYQAFPKTEFVNVNMRDLLIADSLNLGDPDIVEILASDFKHLRRFFERFEEIDFSNVSFDSMEKTIGRTESFEQGYVSILGLQSPKSTLVTFGGVIVFSSLIYFSIHLTKLKKLLVNNYNINKMFAVYSLPWIGLYDDTHSKVILIVTSVVLPISSGGLSLYMLLDLPVNYIRDYTVIIFNIILLIWGMVNVLHALFWVQPRLLKLD